MLSDQPHSTKTKKYPFSEVPQHKIKKAAFSDAPYWIAPVIGTPYRNKK